MNQLGCASGCCVFFSWINTKKISRLLSDILFYNNSSPPLLNFSWTDLWSTSHFLVWQCWNLAFSRLHLIAVRALLAPALALLGLLEQGEVPARPRRAGCSARERPRGGSRRQRSERRAGPGTSSVWQRSAGKHHRVNAKSSPNKVNLLYSYNLFQRSLILGAVALVFNRRRHNKAV